MKDLVKKWDELTRRRFMTAAAGTFLGVNLMPFGPMTRALAAPTGPGKARKVIYLYMAGGMTHLDTFDPKPGQEVQGPVEAIKTSADGIQLSQYLPETARHGDKIAVIRSLTSTQGAHERANYLMHTSYTQRGTIQHPALGAWSIKMSGKLNPTLPGNVLIAGGSQHPGAGFFESRLAPVPIGDPAAGLQNSVRPRNVTAEQQDRRLALSDQLDRDFRSQFEKQKLVRAYNDLYQDALALMRSEDLKAFDLSQESAETKAAYSVPAGEGRRAGNNRFGMGCLLARRLVEHGVRFVEVQLGGWDTHTENFERVPELAAQLDRALGALLSDLHSRGLLSETLVVVATEFGRTPRINDREGRDHYPKAFSGMLAGGGIRGGQVYGKTDANASEVTENPISVQDFNATIAYAMGLDLKQVLYSPSGRPFTVADKGNPIKSLF